MFDFIQHTTSLIYRQGNGSIYRSLKRFLQEECRSALPIILIIFFVTEKFFYFQDHHLTGSDHISNEHENIKNIWFLGYMDSLPSLRS